MKDFITINADPRKMKQHNMHFLIYFEDTRNFIFL